MATTTRRPRPPRRSGEAPRLTVPGYETKSFSWNPTVGSFIVSTFQQHGRDELPGVRKIRWVLDREAVAWRVQIAATPAGHDAVARKVAEVVAEWNLPSARPEVLG